VTNFRGYHQGNIKWKYYITSSDNTKTSKASKFGWESRIPFLSRVLPAGNSNPDKTEDSFLHIKNSNILLVNVKPADNAEGVILQLRETDGLETVLEIDNQLKVIEINALEEDLGKESSQIKFRGFESKFVRILD
jgi:alpha-mannosidase